MVHELDAAEADPGDLVSSLVVPDQALREGPAPELARLDSAEAVRTHAKEWIGARLARAGSRRQTSSSWATTGSRWRRWLTG